MPIVELPRLLLRDVSLSRGDAGRPEVLALQDLGIVQIDQGRVILQIDLREGERQPAPAQQRGQQVLASKARELLDHR